MKSITKYILALSIICLAVYAGFKLSDSWPFGQPKLQIEEEQQILLNRIERVAKLITVEGYFSEIYSYRDYIYFDILPLRKKAIVRVKAKVSIGYDFKKLQIQTIPAQRKIVVTGPKRPELLSLEHDLDYYDLSEGTFNQFDEEDLNRLNQNAKTFIQRKVLESDLMQEAEVQGNELKEAITFMTQAAGWTVDFEFQSNTQQLVVDSLKN